MKHNLFYINHEILAEYLRKYGGGIHSKDYEFAISLHAKEYFEKMLGQQLIIAFEQNEKRHDYPNRFSPNLEQLREIFNAYNEEDTPVDFALARVSSDKFEGYAYPFQVKRFYGEPSTNVHEEFAAFINKKTNAYTASNVGLIFVPQLKGQKVNVEGFETQELISRLNIRDNSVRFVYIFQFVDDVPSFVTIWASRKALAEKDLKSLKVSID